MSDTFDRQGNPITIDQWARSHASDRRVALTELNGLTISTIWLGLNHAFGGGPPLIFETMVFRGIGDDVDYLDVECVRYSTEAAAIAGHAAMVARVEAGEFA